MALVLADRVNETTTTAGTGTLTLAGAVTGYQSFSVVGNGNTTYYTIVGQTTGEWEVGIGTYTSAGTTLSRDTVLASSAGGTTKVTLSAGTKFVFCDYPAGKAVYQDASGTVNVTTVEARTGSGFRSFMDGSASLSSQFYFANAANTRAWNWQLDASSNAALWQYDGTSWTQRAGFDSGSTSLWTARIKFKSADAYTGGTYAVIGLDWGGTAGAYKDFTIYDYVNGRSMFSVYGSTRNVDVFGTGTAGVDFRAPIFYDSDNTAYYLNPASTSLINGLGIGVSPTTPFQTQKDGYNTTAGWYSIARIINAAGSKGLDLGYNNGNNNATLTSYSAGAVSGFEFWLYNGAWVNPMTLSSSSILTVTGSIQAPIFYDSNNTAYYTDPSGTSALNALNVNTWYNYNDNDRNANSATYYPNASARSFRFAFVTAGSVGSGGSYAGLMQFNPWDGTTASTGDASYQLAFGGTAANGSGYPWLQIRKGIDTTWNTFYSFPLYGVNGGGSAGNLFAGVYYDSNNTAYYGDFASTSVVNQINYTALYSSADTNYGIVGGSAYFDTVNSGVAGDPLELCYTRGTEVRIGPSGGTLPIKASIYYDGNNTGYYADPAGTSNFNVLSLSSRAYAGYDSGVTGSFSCNNWFRSSGATGWYNESYGGGIHMSDSTYVRTFGAKQFYCDSVILSAASVRAPIFYDSDDTTYYFDGNADTSVRVYGEICNSNYAQTNLQPGALNIGRTDTNYNWGGTWSTDVRVGILANCADNWEFAIHDSGARVVSPFAFFGGANNYIQMGRDIGWGTTYIEAAGSFRAPIFYYSTDTSIYLAYNSTGTYTPWRIGGSKNSYGGIYDDYSAVNGIMYDSGGNGGVYRAAYGWYFYFSPPNGCMGVNGSATSSSYGLYVTKGIYSTGNIVAYSDVRKKKDIVTIDGALELVGRMRGVYYTRIDADDLKVDSNKRQTGVIAQEMNEVMPEVVTYAADVDEYGVQYGNMAGLFIEAIKELKAEIEELKSRIH